MNERQVIIRGKTFLYRQKAPFVVSGESVKGALEYKPADGRVKCHECGAWFRYLAPHVVQAHPISAREYKLKHGLRLTSALSAPDIRRKLGGNSKPQKRARILDPTIQKAAAMGRQTRKPRTQNTHEWEARNDRGHCAAQVLSTLHGLSERYGRTPTHREIREAGISLTSCLVLFGVKSSTELISLAGLLPRKIGVNVSRNSKARRIADKNRKRKYTPAFIIEFARDFYASTGRVPTGSDCSSGQFVSRYAVSTLFNGGLEEMYRQAGLHEAFLKQRREQRAAAWRRNLAPGAHDAA